MKKCSPSNKKTNRVPDKVSILTPERKPFEPGQNTPVSLLHPRRDISRNEDSSEWADDLRILRAHRFSQRYCFQMSVHEVRGNPVATEEEKALKT
jgi:hypothetical protein